MNETTQLRRAEDTVATEFEDGVVVLHLDSSYFFHLNKVGGRIWMLLEQPLAFGELCARLRDAFDVDAETCTREAEEFVEQMRSSGIIQVETL